jgi:protein SFI1
MFGICSRARYLRLPTTAPRQTVQHSRLVPASSMIAFPRRTTESSIPDPDVDGASDAGASRSSPFQKPVPQRFGIASLLLTSKSVSPDNIRSRPKFSSRGSTREPSPAPSRSSFGAAKRDRSPTKSYSRPPSSAGGEGGKSKLWQELRQAQRRSRPPTERSPSPP